MIRNFCIIAHVDHGKSTLADRLLELTGLLKASAYSKSPSLDTLQVERERGITVKSQTASMLHNHYLLNLMDTPGHIDFGYEVSRSLAACQGAVLLVDATQGVQPQTLGNLRKALELKLDIVPCVNKVDLPTADADSCALQLAELLQIETKGVLRISAKTGLNCDAVLDAVTRRIRPPRSGVDKGLRALVIDSWFDEYRGVVCQISVVSGRIKTFDVLSLVSKPELSFVATEVGHLVPAQTKAEYLAEGHVGYVITGLKSPRDARIGDTLCLRQNVSSTTPIAGFSPARANVFAGLFPVDQRDLQALTKGLEALLLNDPSVHCEPSHNPLLGTGFRLGFLGTLHLDVFRERLFKERAQIRCIVTAPSVAFKVLYKNGKEDIVNSSDKFPEFSDLPRVARVEEPIVRAVIVTDRSLLGTCLVLVDEHRGWQPDIQYTSDTRVRIVVELPLLEIVTDFHDKLQSSCSGHCTFDYEPAGYRASDIVKVRILLNSEPIPSLATLQHASKAQGWSRQWLLNLRETIDRQQFDLAIQAAIGTKVIARETVKALRKDVTAKCYGGDASRQRKLLEKQKEGKEKLKRLGRVQIRHEAFVAIMNHR